MALLSRCRLLHLQVLDASYRKALALPIERCDTSFDPAAHSILKDVQVQTPESLTAHEAFSTCTISTCTIALMRRCHLQRLGFKQASAKLPFVAAVFSEHA